MTAFVRGASPHIRDTSSITSILWARAALLVPALAVAIYFRGVSAVWTAAAATAGAIAAQALGARVFSRPFSFRHADAVTAAWILALLAAPSASWPAVLAAAFLSVYLGREIFGGLGASPFQPAVLGVLILETWQGSPAFISGETMLAFTIAAAGLWLIPQKQLAWELPAIFIASAALITAWAPAHSFIWGPEMAIAAFFLLSDSVSTPMSRSGRRYFALLCGALTGFLIFKLTARQAVSTAFFAASIAAPWLDIFVRPKAARR